MLLCWRCCGRELGVLLNGDGAVLEDMSVGCTVGESCSAVGGW